MDSKEEFYDPDENVKKLIWGYLMNEVQDLMAAGNFYRNDKNNHLCMLAVSKIAKLWKIFGRDTFIPYLAMNYFDRFLSSKCTILEGLEDHHVIEKVSLIAVSCLTIAANRRQKDFAVDRFVGTITSRKPDPVKRMITEIEVHIQLGETWEMQSVTAFTFLNYYYHYFKTIGFFKRSLIYEIIVQAQGDHAFVNYRPSLMAFSAFIAASMIAYPSKCNEVANASPIYEFSSKEQVEECVNLMVNLCNAKKIKIELHFSEVGTSSKSETETQKLAKGKGKVGTSSKLETVPEEVEEFSDSDREDVAKMAIEAETQKLAKGMGKEVNEAETRKLFIGKGKEVIEADTCDEDKARTEAITLPTLEKGKAAVKEDAQPRIAGKAHSEFLELVAPKAEHMNFELKWPTLETKHAQPKNFGCGSCNIV